jgi:hypothetical protein
MKANTAATMVIAHKLHTIRFRFQRAILGRSYLGGMYEFTARSPGEGAAGGTIRRCGGRGEPIGLNANAEKDKHPDRDGPSGGELLGPGFDLALDFGEGVGEGALAEAFPPVDDGEADGVVG